MTEDRGPRQGAKGSLARRLDVPFIGSLVIVVLAYVIALSLLRLVIPDNEVAATISAMVIGAGPRVQREFESLVPRAPVPLVTFDGYRLRWWWLLAGGAVGLWMAENARIILEVRGGPATAISASIEDALTLLPVGIAIAIGVLAGARSDRWPLAVAIIAIVLGHGAGVASSDGVVAFAVGADPSRTVCAPSVPPTDGVGPPAQGPPSGPPGADPCAEAPPDPRIALFGSGLAGALLADELPMLVFVGMAGLWWGSRMRYAFYLGHVAGSLDDADRAALLEMATDEQQRGQHADSELRR